MNLALYYPWIHLRGGAERTILELVRRSRHGWTIYTNHFDPESTFPEFSEVPVVGLRQVSVRRGLRPVAGAAISLLRQRVDFRGHDALFVVSEGLGNLVTYGARVPASCICLTPLKVAYDEHTRMRFFGRRWRLHYRAAFALYREVERPAWRRYRRVFCNSREVRRRLLDSGLVEPDRMEVAHHGVDLERFRPGARSERYFLAAGRITFQKNLELAIEAWKRFQPEPHPGGFRLVVAGMVHEKSRSYLAALRSLAGGRPDVTFVENPDDARLLELYQGSRAVLFTPVSEDWGLVPLEAMACGKPVLAVARGGPLESVIQGRTGRLCADDPAAFADAIAWAAGLPASRLREVAAAARERAAEFPWGGFVDRIDAHAEQLAEAAPAVAPAYAR